VLIFCSSGLGRGGAELFLARLAANLNTRQQDEILVIGLKRYASSETLDLLEASDVRFVNGLNFWSALLLIFKLQIRYTREPAKSISIHGWMYHGTLVSVLLRVFLFPATRGTRSGCFVRQTLQDIKTQKLLSRVVIKLCAKISHQFDFVCYNSIEAIEQHSAIGFKPQTTVYLPNFFDSRINSDNHGRKRAYPGQKDWEIGWIGRDHPMKNLSGCADLFDRLFNTYGYRFRLLLAGVERDQAEKYFSSSLISQKVICPLGSVRNIPRFLDSIDILVSTSVYGEGCSNAIGEAILAGCFVFGPKLGAIPDMLLSEDFLYSPGDMVELQEKIVRLIDHPSGLADKRLCSYKNVATEYAEAKIMEGFSSILWP
jgi:glycosyltransferase involved in cell wall biosynthesis